MAALQRSKAALVGRGMRDFVRLGNAQVRRTKGRENMRKSTLAIIVVMMAAAVSFSSLFCTGPTPVLAQSASDRVLMIPREGYSQDIDLMISSEVGVMTKLLTSAGFKVDIATTSGSPIVGPTHKIDNVLMLSEVDMNAYAGVIMPCMAVGLFPGPPVAPEAVTAVKKAVADGKPVAASLGSINVLAEAGVLKGRKYAYFKDPMKADAEWPRTDRRYADAIYTGPGTTQDGRVITCGVCPNIEKRYGWGFDPFDIENGTVKLTKTFITAIRSR
jgi:putative intracellular protease/amidase